MGGARKDIEVSFRVSALRAPNNHLTSSGRVANDPTTLDAQEFDGWIVIDPLTSEEAAKIEQKQSESRVRAKFWCTV